MKDPYEVLGVGRNATLQDIKTRYRKLAREFHPDSDPGNPWIEDRFKDIAAAYDLLSDPVRRGRFDRGEVDAEGKPRRRRRDPFEEFRKKQRGQRGIKAKGANVAYTLTVGLADALRGTTRRIAMTHGQHLQVKVPAGTRDGQVLRLRGQGMPGLGGGEAGDAHIEIRVASDSEFTIEGDDVRSELGVSLPEAVLGGRVEVDTLDGRVKVTVPAGSNTGTVLRLRGRGLPRAAAEGNDGPDRGDHLVRLQVMLPRERDDDLVDFVRRWSETRPHPVRRKP